MVSFQWQELQRQIRRQHNWMIRTLDAIKTHILSGERNEEHEARAHHDSPEVRASAPYPKPESFHLSHANTWPSFADFHKKRIKKRVFGKTSISRSRREIRVIRMRISCP